MSSYLTRLFKPFAFLKIRLSSYIIIVVRVNCAFLTQPYHLSIYHLLIDIDIDSEDFLPSWVSFQSLFFFSRKWFFKFRAIKFPSIFYFLHLYNICSCGSSFRPKIICTWSFFALLSLAGGLSIFIVFSKKQIRFDSLYHFFVFCFINLFSYLYCFFFCNLWFTLLFIFFLTLSVWCLPHNVPGFLL